MNDAELVRKILAGDEDRFGEIVERYARRVWALCASYIHNPSDCEDLVQESFIHGYLRLNTIREPNAFGAWLGQVARTRCLEWLRKRTREKDAITGLKEGPVEAPADTTPSESAQREEMHAFVRRNLDALPEKYREALYLFYIGGHSVAEAAHFLDISDSAMKKRLQLGREKLREQVSCAIEEALGDEKPRPGLQKAVLAVIPFGKAAWLGKGGLLSGATAAQTGIGASLAGFGWVVVAVSLAASSIGGYVFYKGHHQLPVQARTSSSSEISGQSVSSGSSDVSDASESVHSPFPPAALPAQAGRTGSEDLPEPTETVSSSQDLVHWKWERNAEPPQDAGVAKALRGPVSIQFEGEYIARILAFISEYIDVSIVLDSRAVPPAADMSAWDYRALVWERYPKCVPAYVTDGLVESIKLTGVPLSAALEHLLYPLGLVYEVKPFGIFVTNPNVHADSVEDNADDALSRVNQALSENVSIEFRYEHVDRILEFVAEYATVNIVVDHSVVTPPDERSVGLPAVQLLEVSETPDGGRRALLRFGATQPHWYEEGDRMEEYLLHTINPRWGIVELFSEQQRHNFQFRVEERKTDAPGFPESPPTMPSPLVPPDPQILQQWLRCLRGKEYVTDGLVDYINLRDVELRYTLDALLTPLNLTYENEGDYFFVSSPELLAQDNDRATPESEITPELRDALAHHVSIEFEGEELVHVLEFLAGSAKADIAMGSKYVEIRRPENKPPQLAILPAADWTVSYCNLRDVPLQAALDALLRQYGLDFQPAGDRILVGTPEKLSARDELAGDYWVSLSPDPVADLSDTAP